MQSTNQRDEQQQRDYLNGKPVSCEKVLRKIPGQGQRGVQRDLAAALKGAQAVMLAVPHAPYLQLDPDEIVKWAGAPLAVVDCFGILDDEKIRRYFELGCEVKALGRGHIQRIKEEVRKRLKREA